MVVELFIGSLPTNVSSQDISMFMTDWIVPETVRVVSDRETGRSKGFAFMWVEGPADAVVAARADGHFLLGRPLSVSVVRRSSVRVRSSSTSGDMALPEATQFISLEELQIELRNALKRLPDENLFWVRNSLMRLNKSDPDHGQDLNDRSARELFLQLVQRLSENPQLLVDVDPRLFEHLVASVYQASGYVDVRLTVASADGGVDVYVEKQIGTSRIQTIVQVKRFAVSRKVGRPEVQLLYGVLSSSSATNAALVTTSSFTRPAEVFLDEHPFKITGTDGTDFKNWLKATAQIAEAPAQPGWQNRQESGGADFRHRSW